MSKRGHNEGSIYQRESDGKWVGSVHIGYGINGKRKRKMFYGDTRREVAEKLKIALRDQQLGLPIAVVRQSLGQFLDQWLADVVKPTVRDRTYESYAHIVRAHLKPALGCIQLDKLTAQDIQKYMNAKRATGLSARTVQYHHGVLRSALQRAMKWDLVPRNVAKLADPPTVRRPEIKPWNIEQAREFLQAVKGDRLEALYSVALAMGLRRGEALGLSWEDVDLDKGTLSVRKALQRVGSNLQLAETKTDRSRRTIALPKVAVAALRVHKIRQLQQWS